MECAAFMIPGTGITRPGPCCLKPHELYKVVCQELVKSDSTQKISCFFWQKIERSFCIAKATHNFKAKNGSFYIYQ